MAATFNDLADRLARQESDRLTFLGGVAHDLRNPLGALRMATEVVRRGKRPPSPERMERTLAIVARQIERLDRMVGDLLDSTRIESGRLELRPEPLDVRPIVGHVVELYRPVSPAHEIVFVEPKRSGGRGLRPDANRTGDHQPGKQRGQVLAGWRTSDRDGLR